MLLDAIEQQQRSQLLDKIHEVVALCVAVILYTYAEVEQPAFAFDLLISNNLESERPHSSAQIISKSSPFHPSILCFAFGCDDCNEVSKKLLSLDPERLGNRGPRRYSFGGASRTLHMMPLAKI